MFCYSLPKQEVNYPPPGISAFSPVLWGHGRKHLGRLKFKEMLSLTPCSLSGTCRQPRRVLRSSPAGLGQDGPCCSPLGSAVAKPLRGAVGLGVCCLRREKQGCSFRMGCEVSEGSFGQHCEGRNTVCVCPHLGTSQTFSIEEHGRGT